MVYQKGTFTYNNEAEEAEVMVTPNDVTENMPVEKLETRGVL